MRQTLFFIPDVEIAGLPVFGAGWLLLAWAVFGATLLGWLARKPESRGEAWSYLPLLALMGGAIWLLLPRLCEAVPGWSGARGLPIRGYGAVLLVAVASAVGLAAWRGRRLGLDPEVVFSLSVWVFVPGIVGARAFYVIEYWADFPKETLWQTLGAMVNVTQGGLVVYGSVIGGTLGLIGFVWKYKMPLLATFDLMTPSLLLGMAIGRLGCLLNGCCFGGVCDLPWAIDFPGGPPASPAYSHQVLHGETFVQGLKIRGASGAKPVIGAVRPESPAAEQGLGPGQQILRINGFSVRTVDGARRELLRVQERERQIAIETSKEGPVATWPITHPLPRSEKVHPTQLYSTTNALLLCLFLLACAPFCRRDGVIWATFLTLYPITRFLLEMIRTDEPGFFLRGVVGEGLTISQTVSVFVLIGAGVFWAYVLMRPPREGAAIRWTIPDSVASGRG
jgi:phosphatidylglycerol:prolipoprotein diacylglycerol transferase